MPERYLADLRRGASVTVTTVAFRESVHRIGERVDPILDPTTLPRG